MSVIGENHIQVLYDQLPAELRIAYRDWCISVTDSVVSRTMHLAIDVLIDEWLAMRFNKLVSLLLEKPS